MVWERNASSPTETKQRHIVFFAVVSEPIHARNKSRLTLTRGER
jgi:hypothetical protein